MKHLLYAISAIILAAVLGGCADPEVDRRLARAEALMMTAPDSALAILDSVDTTTIHDVGNQALYALLLTQAQDKNFIDKTDTSLISQAVRYYADNGSRRNRMLSLYYLGKIQLNAADYPQAVVNFLKAEKLATDLDDPKYLGMICREISTIYEEIYASKEQLHYSRKAYDAFRLHPDSSYAWYSMNDLARAYCLALDYGNSLKFSAGAKRAAEKAGDSLLLGQALSLVGISQIGLGEYGKAVATYESMMRLHPLDSIDTQRYMLAVAHAGDTGKIDSLSHGCNESVPHELSVQYGDYKSAYNSLIARCRDQDALIRRLLTQNVTRAIDNYNLAEASKLEIRLKKSNVQKALLVAAVIAAVAALLGVHLKKTAELRRKEKSFVLDVQNLKDELRSRDKAAALIVSDLIGKKYEIIDRLCSTYYSTSQTPKSQKQILSEIKKQIDGLLSNELGLEELETYVNKYTGDLVARAREQYPDLRNRDINLLLYLMVGFSTRTIGVFIGEKPDVVYNRKSRLKSRIKETDAPCRDALLAYF